MRWTQTTTSWPLPASPAEIFAALTDGARLRTWFAEHAEVEPRVGGAFRFWGRHTLGVPSAAEATQRLTAFVPDESLSFTWTLLGVPSDVQLTLIPEEKGPGTKIRAEHAFERELAGVRTRELVDDFWKLAFGNLSVHLGSGMGLLLPDFNDPSPEIRLSVVIDAPPPDVFRALVDPALVNQWAGSTSASIDARAGGVYSFGWVYEIDGRTVHGGPTRILEFEVDKRLVVDWPDWRGDVTVTGQTVAFTLTPEGKGTRVELVHEGFTRPADISDYPFGWGYFLAEIQRVALAAR